jgi:hypothetical protein
VSTPPSDFPDVPAEPLPSAPPVVEGELRRPDRPRAVDIAFLCWLVVVGTSLVSDVVGLLISKQVAHQAILVLQQRGVDTSQIPQTGQGIGTTVYQFVVLAAYVGLAFGMRAGTNWTKVVLTILGILGVVVTVFAVLLSASILGAVGFGGLVELLMSVLSVVAVIAAIVFMYRPETRPYFKPA